MPLYEFQCGACQQEVEILVRSGEEELACPECGGHSLERLMSVTARPAVNSSLPVCSPTPPPGDGCGLPQCGQGRCAGLE